MTTSITREQFLQALRDHPEWREEIRGQILGEELMRLPLAFQTFVVKQEKFNDEMQKFRAETLRRFDLIDNRFDNIDNRLDRMDNRFDQMDNRFDNIDNRLDRMEGDSSWLKNASTEAMAATGAFAICLAAGCEMTRVLDRNDVVAIAKQLTGANITPGDRASFARADLIIEATGTATGETVYLTVEVSYTAAHRDRERAQRNAAYLTSLTGSRAIPVVAGVRYDRELQEDIEAGELTWFEIDEP